MKLAKLVTLLLLGWAPAAMGQGYPTRQVHIIVPFTAGAGQAPDVKERLAALGAEPMPMNSSEFKQFVDAEITESAKVIKAAGIKPQ